MTSAYAVAGRCFAHPALAGGSRRFTAVRVTTAETPSQVALFVQCLVKAAVPQLLVAFEAHPCPRELRERAAATRRCRGRQAARRQPPRQIVLAWLLARSPQMLPIPGTGSPEHAEANVAAASIELSPDEVAAVTGGA